MKIKQLREWQSANPEDNRWWVILDGVMEETPLSLDELEQALRTGYYAETKVLHISQTELENPLWVSVEFSNENHLMSKDEKPEPIDSARHSLVCPSCREISNIARCEAIYESGTTSVTGYRGAAVVYNMDGDFRADSFIGGGSSSSTHQTVLAAKCAPPKRPSDTAGPLLLLLFGGGWGCLLVGALGLYGRGDDSSIPLIIWLLVIGVIMVALGILLRKNGKEKLKKGNFDYHISYREWKDRWVCMRCGTIFQRHIHTPNI